LEQIVRLEKEMNQVQVKYKDAEENYGSELLNLVVAKGYLTKLVSNTAVKSYIARHTPEIMEHFELVVNTISMEEALQQQAAGNGSTGIAAYIADMVGDEDDEDDEDEKEPENEEAGGDFSGDAPAEPVDAEGDVQPEGVTATHGAFPSQAAEGTRKNRRSAARDLRLRKILI
jgi:RepB plasmid partitioning protein